MKKVQESIEIGGRKLTLTTGEIANQADGAIMAQYGETVVLATVVSAPLREDPGYFPLKVDYMERLYAGGRIKGSRWVKREGRPLDDEILTARLIDRSIRPLFPQEYYKDIQVILTVLSIDFENRPDIVSSLAVSAALACSPIPWNGPVATVKVGLKDGKYLTNPTEPDLADSEMELVVSATNDAIVMIENGAKEVSEEEVIKGLAHAQKEIKTIISFLQDFAKKAGQPKEKISAKTTDSHLEKKVKELVGERLKKLIPQLASREASYYDFEALKSALAAEFSESESKKEALLAFEALFKKEIRQGILKNKRPDGRKSDELRKLSAQVGVLPRTHGSALFQRGQTQVLTVVTLASPAMEQLIESAEGQETKRYIHHYSMPPYSTGETGRLGWPSRREIGHGALAEKALVPVIPAEEEFPYTTRVVSEVTSSNGSTSMASTCGSTLSLMDAGVPLTRPVAGIAMGLVVESKDNYVVLTDIAGVEDSYGDMDFKVAGTEKGITALQLDVKTLNLNLEMLKNAFAQAKKARLEILKVMTAAISKPREQVSQYAPKIKTYKVAQDKIGEVIGPGGRTIKGIIKETGAQVDVSEEGVVSITSTDSKAVDQALAKVEALVKEVVPGEIYEAEVKRLEPYGAFVELLPGKGGLVHISDMSVDFVKDPKDLVKIGDRVKVKVKEIDNLGRINLTMVLDGSKPPRRKSSPPQSKRPRKGGPHFPVSRLVEPKKRFSR